MINIKVVYNSEIKGTAMLAETVEAVYGPRYKVELFDEKYTKEKKLGAKVKGAFGARLIPFIGVYIDKRAIKGLYEEAGEANMSDLINFIEGSDAIRKHNEGESEEVES